MKGKTYGLILLLGGVYYNMIRSIKSKKNGILLIGVLSVIQIVLMISFTFSNGYLIGLSRSIIGESSINENLETTIRWYLDNQEWWKDLATEKMLDPTPWKLYRK